MEDPRIQQAYIGALKNQVTDLEEEVRNLRTSMTKLTAICGYLYGKLENGADPLHLEALLPKIEP